jgi:hypothetical protein
MKYLSVSYTSIWVVRWWGAGGVCERVRSHVIERGVWTGVSAIGNMLGHIYC